MKKVITPLTNASAGKGEIAQAADVYQSSCWHCKAPWFVRPAIVRDNGLECAYCGQLNYYGDGFKP